MGEESLSIVAVADSRTAVRAIEVHVCASLRTQVGRWQNLDSLTA